jgi:hypothetical protein
MPSSLLHNGYEAGKIERKCVTLKSLNLLKNLDRCKKDYEKFHVI